MTSGPPPLPAYAYKRTVLPAKLLWRFTSAFASWPVSSASRNCLVILEPNSTFSEQPSHFQSLRLPPWPPEHEQPSSSPREQFLVMVNTTPAAVMACMKDRSRVAGSPSCLSIRTRFEKQYSSIFRLIRCQNSIISMVHIFTKISILTYSFVKA